MAIMAITTSNSMSVKAKRLAADNLILIYIYGWRRRKNSFVTAGLFIGNASCVLVAEPGTSNQLVLTATLTALLWRIHPR